MAAHIKQGDALEESKPLYYQPLNPKAQPFHPQMLQTRQAPKQCVAVTSNKSPLPPKVRTAIGQDLLQAMVAVTSVFTPRKESLAVQAEPPITDDPKLLEEPALAPARIEEVSVPPPLVAARSQADNDTSESPSSPISHTGRRLARDPNPPFSAQGHISP